MLSRTASSLLRRQSTRSVAKFEATAAASIHTNSAVFCRATAPSAVSASSTLDAHNPAAAYGTVPRRRNFSDNTHDDFAPKKTTIEEGEDEAIQMIQQHVNDNPVMLYMKGNPSSPMCGFSAKIVQTLQAEGIDFSSVNVLDYPSIREGVKKFAAWPTM